MNEHAKAIAEFLSHATYIILIAGQGAMDYMNENYQGLGVLIALMTGLGTLYFKRMEVMQNRRLIDRRKLE